LQEIPEEIKHEAYIHVGLTELLLADYTVNLSQSSPIILSHTNITA
jgi:hypothetical protein